MPEGEIERTRLRIAQLQTKAESYEPGYRAQDLAACERLHDELGELAGP